MKPRQSILQESLVLNKTNVISATIHLSFSSSCLRLDLCFGRGSGGTFQVHFWGFTLWTHIYQEHFFSVVAKRYAR